MECNLQRANLSGIRAENGNFHGADLSGSVLSHSHLRGAMFQKSTLLGTELSGCDLRETFFDEARGGQVNFTDSNLSFSSFANAVLTGSKLMRTNFFRAKLHNFTDTGSTWDEANLTFVQRTDPDRLAAESYAPAGP